MTAGAWSSSLMLQMTDNQSLKSVQYFWQTRSKRLKRHDSPVFFNKRSTVEDTKSNNNANQILQSSRRVPRSRGKWAWESFKFCSTSTSCCSSGWSSGCSQVLVLVLVLVLYAVLFLLPFWLLFCVVNLDIVLVADLKDVIDVVMVLVLDVVVVI